MFNDKDTAKSYVDPTVRFRPDKAFSPRAAFWDLAGGFGRLNTYHGPYAQDSTSVVEGNGQQQEFTVEKIKRETGASTTAAPLKNTYWTDYLNLNVHPSSLVTVPNWEYDPVLYPLGKQVGDQHDKPNPFCGFELGIETWNQVSKAEGGKGTDDSEYLDAHVRRLLEQCDLFSGLSVTTNVDSAFASFTSRLLDSIKDNYAPKADTFVWAIQGSESQRLQRHLQFSRIESTVSLIERCSLYIPLVSPQDIVVPANLDPLYYTTAAFNTVYESYSLLSSLRNAPRVSMAELSWMLNEGSSRKVVDASSAILGQDIDASYDFSLSNKNAQKHTFTKTGIVRSPREPVPVGLRSKPTLQSVPPSQNPWDAIFSAQGNSDEGVWEKYSGEKVSKITKLSCPEPVAVTNSTPEELLNSTCEQLSMLSMSDGPSMAFKKMDELVYRIGKAFVDNRDELRQDLGKLRQDHSFGTENSDESDDDYN